MLSAFPFYERDNVDKNLRSSLVNVLSLPSNFFCALLRKGTNYGKNFFKVSGEKLKGTQYKFMRKKKGEHFKLWQMICYHCPFN